MSNAKFAAFLTALLGGALLLAGCASKAQRQSRMVKMAEHYNSEAKYSEAIIEYRNALQLQPDSASLHFKLGEAYASNHQFPEAFSELRKAVAIQPDYPEAQMAMGRFYLVAKRYPDALKEAQAVLAKHADSGAAI